MKRSLIVAASLLLLATQASATYIVVLKGGAQYKAKEKWTLVNGKARVLLENGQILDLDPSLIDVAKSEQFTKAGVSNARILDLDPNLPQSQQEQKKSIGSTIKIRQINAAETKPAETVAAPVKTGPMIGSLVLEKFDLAYDNVGIFEHTIKAIGATSLRGDLTVDSEDKVFNALTATSFLMVRGAGVSGAKIDMVELFMKQTNGGASGRFQMTLADAQALDAKTVSVQDYFVRKVIY